MRILGLLLGLAMICSNANAAIVLTIGTASSNVGSGFISVDVFARSTANESLTTIAADFTLQAGNFGTTAGVFGVDSTYIGGDGFNGQVGKRLDDAGSFFLSAGDNNGSLSLEFFNPGQPILATDSKLATLLINKAGVGAGTYSITAGTFGSTPNSSITSNVGSFSIVAVPEPTSIALLSVAIGGVFGRRLLRSRRRLARNV